MDKINKNIAIMDTKLELMVQLINESEASTLFEGVAAVVLANPTVTWAKFVLTDNKVNGNKQRIPDAEFANLINTGINMPIKMAVGGISKGHEGTKPIGVLTHLREFMTETGTKAIMALAALWSGERPDDVNLLKDRFKNGTPINVSWEILYEDAVFNSAEGSMDLINTALKAATIVGDPAYQGRTQFLTVAAKKWSKAYIEELPKEHFLLPDYGGKNHLPIMDASGKLDRAKLQEALVELGSLDLPVNLLKEKKATILNLLEKFDAGASIDEVSNQFYAATNVTLEENKLDELELLKAKLLEVEAKLNEAINSVETEKTASAEKQASLSTLEETVSRLTEELKTANTELESLREFKAQLDTKAELGVKLDGIKAKFVEAGVERDNKYYAENAETLLKLDEAGISLLVKDVLLAAEASLTEDKVTKRIPALLNDDENYLGDPKELGRLLRERKAKK